MEKVEAKFFQNTPPNPHVQREISTHVDGGASAGSSMRRPGSRIYCLVLGAVQVSHDEDRGQGGSMPNDQT